MFYKLIDVVWHLAVPWLRLCFSAYYFPLTIFHLIATRQFSTFYSLSALKSAWFAKFWARAGPGTRENAAPNVGPLLSQARGVVIEIGPGSGDWIKTYDKNKITKIYGVEPNLNHHGRLRARIAEAGMGDIYTIVPVGIKEWISKEAKGVDTIVTIQCLCSVPTPKKMIAELYGHLNKGGQWIVYEHVVTPYRGPIACYQGEYGHYSDIRSRLLRTGEHFSHKEQGRLSAKHLRLLPQFWSYPRSDAAS